MTALRVLHVSGGDLAGGAARAALRIHAALRRQGVDSRFLSARGEPGPDRPQPLSPLAQFSNRVKLAASARMASWQRTPSNPVMRSLNCFGSGLGRWIHRSDADIVHLHWIGDEALSVAEIAALRQPVCWTMHDMWPFCGAEHYDDLQHPGRYRTGYEAATRASNASGPDLDAWAWRRKRRAWANRRLHLVGPSQWIADCAAASQLMVHQPRRVIPNCLDTDCFAPQPAAVARAAWGLRPDRRYVLFGAQSGTGDPRKGFPLLLEALGLLARDPRIAADTELLVFGPASEGLAAIGLPVRHVGQVADERRLAQLYAAADVFAAPSMQDNLPNTVVESLACGTPCVAFAVGGLPELLTHRATGWLARPFDTGDFCAGLKFLLENRLRERCRSDALARHGMDFVATQYLALYREMLQAR